MEKSTAPDKGGRPSTPRSIRAMASRHTRAAVTSLTGILSDAQATPQTRLEAARVLLDTALRDTAGATNLASDVDLPVLSLAAVLGDAYLRGTLTISSCDPQTRANLRAILASFARFSTLKERHEQAAN